MKFIQTLTTIKDYPLAAYMAGFLEADGALAPRRKKGVIKTYELHFAFNKDDLVFATFLKDYFNMGQITIKSYEHSITWSITSIGNVINFLSFINGFLRGPKTVTLWQALDFLNKKFDLSIPLLPINNSPILSNAWLAGFSDGDSTFQISLSKEEPNTVSLNPYYCLEVAEFYIKHQEEAFINHQSNSLYMQPLADALNVKLERVERVSSLRVRASRVDNTKLLIDYFTQYPLFSTKYINYLDWVKVIALRNKAKSIGDPLYTIYEEVLGIKNNYNSKRDPNTYTWHHLDNFYKLPSDYPNHQIKLWKRKK